MWQKNVTFFVVMDTVAKENILPANIKILLSIIYCFKVDQIANICIKNYRTDIDSR